MKNRKAKYIKIPRTLLLKLLLLTSYDNNKLYDNEWYEFTTLSKFDSNFLNQLLLCFDKDLDKIKKYTKDI